MWVSSLGLDRVRRLFNALAGCDRSRCSSNRLDQEYHPDSAWKQVILAHHAGFGRQVTITSRNLWVSVSVTRRFAACASTCKTRMTRSARHTRDRVARRKAETDCPVTLVHTTRTKTTDRTSARQEPGARLGPRAGAARSPIGCGGIGLADYSSQDTGSIPGRP